MCAGVHTFVHVHGAVVGSSSCAAHAHRDRWKSGLAPYRYPLLLWLKSLLGSIPYAASVSHQGQKRKHLRHVRASSEEILLSAGQGGLGDRVRRPKGGCRWHRNASSSELNLLRCPVKAPVVRPGPGGRSGRGTVVGPPGSGLPQCPPAPWGQVPWSHAFAGNMPMPRGPRRAVAVRAVVSCRYVQPASGSPIKLAAGCAHRQALGRARDPHPTPLSEPWRPGRTSAASLLHCPRSHIGPSLRRIFRRRSSSRQGEAPAPCQLRVSATRCCSGAMAQQPLAAATRRGSATSQPSRRGSSTPRSVDVLPSAADCGADHGVAQNQSGICPSGKLPMPNLARFAEIRCSGQSLKSCQQVAPPADFGQSGRLRRRFASGPQFD